MPQHYVKYKLLFLQTTSLEYQRLRLAEYYVASKKTHLATLVIY